ncbi:MAG: hypothetical protein Q9M32_07605 [Sulfurimonas sp.]|nr:hypothetical protein [Sulfurimonas sp.]
MYAMLLITFVAYNVGNIIRFNIKNLKPILQTTASKKTLILEKFSDIALLVAYVVSVSLYLHILSAFTLSSIGIDSDLNENILTTSIIVLITFIGMTSGLRPLEILEKYALFITLVVVFLLIIAFGIYDFKLYTSGANFIMPEASKHSNFEIVAILAGMLIVVQGFETSRYLRNTYSAELRIKTSKYSQIISTIVYIIFIALAMPVTHLLNGIYNENSLITLVGFVSTSHIQKIWMSALVVVLAFITVFAIPAA